MRKLLIFAVLVFVVIWGIIFTAKGVNRFVTVYSFDEISQKQKEVNSKITEIKSLQNKTLKENTNRLNSAANYFSDVKDEYEDLLVLASDDEKEEAIMGDYYDIEYLWTKLGVYSTKYGVDIGLTVSRSTFSSTNSSSDYQLCDFDFSVEGTYINVTDYIYSMEDDSDLNFNIRNFKMISSGEGKVSCTFTVDSIPVATAGLSGLGSTSMSTSNSSSNGGTTGNTSSTGTTNASGTSSNSSNGTSGSSSNDSSNSSEGEQSGSSSKADATKSGTKTY